MSALLERVKMCVAEAGYDPALVWPCDDDCLASVPASWPDEVVWRALSLANDGSWDNQCLACFIARRTSCAAVPFTLDCGVDRG